MVQSIATAAKSGVAMSDESDLTTGDQFGLDDEEDVFHDADGLPVLGLDEAFEVGLYAHHCWQLSLDPDETAALLRGD